MDIHVASYGPILDQSVVQPVGDELESVYQARVSVSIVDREPPAAGMSEIAMTILATGAIGLLVKFFEPLVAHAGEQLRDKLLAAIREGKSNKETGRRYVPVCIEFGISDSEGPVRYCFHGEIDEEELLLRLRAAQEHIQTLPPELFAVASGPLVNGFFWDEAAGRWRGQVSGLDQIVYGEFWLPDDLWDC